MTTHQQKQLEVIQRIDQQINTNKLSFTTVPPVEDFENDSRMCVTSVHFPDRNLQDYAQQLISELKKVEPDYYYYDNDSLHMTIKNVKVINDPPTFNKQDIQTVKKVFSKIVPKHKSFKVYFYRLLLLPNNVSIIGTTDEELDAIVLDLDTELSTAGVPDDKVYSNKKYFFSNMTIARFNGSSEKFKSAVEKLSQTISIPAYEVDSVSLITGNAVLKKLEIIETWPLQHSPHKSVNK